MFEETVLPPSFDKVPLKQWLAKHSLNALEWPALGNMEASACSRAAKSWIVWKNSWNMKKFLWNLTAPYWHCKEVQNFRRVATPLLGEGYWDPLRWPMQVDLWPPNTRRVRGVPCTRRGFRCCWCLYVSKRNAFDAFNLPWSGLWWSNPTLVVGLLVLIKDAPLDVMFTTSLENLDAKMIHIIPEDSVDTCLFCGNGVS